MAEGNEVYRFRKVERLLGECQELEKQEIYFASPEELNDPMEAFRPMVWRGDHIVWRNLFRHYVNCLAWTFMRYQIGGDLCLRDIGIPVLWNLGDSMTPELEELHTSVFRRFGALSDLNSCIAVLDNYQDDFRAAEMLLLLRGIHHVVLHSIVEEHRTRGLLNLGESPNPFPSDAPTVSLFVKLLEEGGQPLMIARKAFELVSKQMESLFFQSSYLRDINTRDDLHEAGRDNERFIGFDFPEYYVHQLNQLVCTPWYAACFCRTYKSSLLWTHYGDHHRGACLVFGTVRHKGGDAMSVTRANKLRNGRYESGAGLVKLRDVEYKRDVDEIDFFRSVGALPAPRLEDTWYRGEDGQVSECAAHLSGDTEQWQREYRARFDRGAVEKGPEWEHEHETRLVINGITGDLDAKQRLASYDFGALKGIIFGLRTPHVEKINVVDVIKKICEECKRPEFPFWQTYYSRREACLGRYHLWTYSRGA